MRAAVIHRAARPEGLVQRCVLCGMTLIDRSGERTLTSDAGELWWAGCVEVQDGGQVSTILMPNCVDRTLVQFD